VPRPSRIVTGPPSSAPDYLVVVADMQPATGSNVPPQVVSAQVRALNPAPSLLLFPGDITNDGTTAEYTIWDGYYGSTFGTAVRPAPGNHDHAPNGDPANTPTNLAAYNTYFGALAHSGATPPSFYSFDTPAGWHIIGLDSGTQWVGSISNPSTTYTAVSNDLAANTGKPLIAFWHHPRWSDGTNTADPGGTGDTTELADIWNLLYSYHADLVFNGHCHSYQRFPKFGTTGTADAAGICEIVVGTGGSGLHTLTGAGRAVVNSYQSAAYDQVNSQWFGFLKLWLYPYPWSYSWQFVSQNAAGSQNPGAILDSGGPVPSNL
jgi:hypothetical protein